METEHHCDRAAMGMARQNVLSAPYPARRWPTSFAGGGMRLGKLFSRGNVDADEDNSANEDGWFRMNVPPLII
jgi:hypothetical protein